MYNIILTLLNNEKKSLFVQNFEEAIIFEQDFRDTNYNSVLSVQLVNGGIFSIKKSAVASIEIKRSL